MQKTLYDVTNLEADKEILLISKSDFEAYIPIDTCYQAEAVKIELFRCTIDAETYYNAIIRLAVGEENPVWTSFFTMMTHENADILAMGVCEIAETMFGREVINDVEVNDENGKLIRTLSLDELAETYSDVDFNDEKPAGMTLH